MRRPVLTLLALFLLPLVASLPIAAQSDQPHVYEMYFEIDFPDLPAWIEFYQTHEVPVLERLVEEGVLNDFGVWTHEAGGEYNLRYNIVAPNWAALGDFQDAYFSRMDPETLAGALSMVREHTDEIWSIGASNFPEGWEEARLTYEAAYGIGFAGIEQWNTQFQEYARPALERAIDEGMIEAWVSLNHSTGGDYTSKFIYWIEDWDQTDDALAFLAQTRQELGAEMEGGRVIHRHSDNIWRPVPRR